MKRNILSKLIEWKNKKNRKPLIVNGARQVGKTYILREFGTSQYEKMAYINCDKNKILEKIFSQDYNISRILLSLSAILHVNIEPENTLIIFDEIQESPIVLNSLKYFCPQIRNYAPNMIQKRKESASLVKRGHSASNVTIKTYKCPLPHHAT
ncbi:MAG: AAA family ATPase [Prevotella sp.]|nr:AAA family ATPase [Prevotella sp.]